MSRYLLRKFNFTKLLTEKNNKRFFSVTTVLRQSDKKNDSFLNGTNSVYMEMMYESWLEDPSSVHKSWDAYFRTSSFQSPPNLGVIFGNNQPNTHQMHAIAQPMNQLAPPHHSTSSSSQKDIEDHLAVQAIIRGYQTDGHHIAQLDPLGILDADLSSEIPYNLVLSNYHFSDQDLDRVFTLPPTTFVGGNASRLELKEIINRLQKCYSHHVGVEYLHLHNPEYVQWIKRRLEWPGIADLDTQEKRRALSRLIRATKLEEFLAKKWPSEKRFGLEGCEVLIPAMKTIIDVVSDLGIETINMGMPHRGRLNVLSNVTRKPLEEVFCQFESQVNEDEEGSGDVKYHLGACTERLNRVNGKLLKLAIVANPSHLEAVDPVVIGKTRAEQVAVADMKGDKCMSMLLHGDAAFAGQGIVYETFHLSDLPAYTTHGTIHLVVNNQIGFTTDPRVARSSPYCTDVARVVNAPIFHVNADDVEAVIHVCKVAAEYRCRFKSDVVIDLVCYRRFGHNEMDNPMFTNPFMYKAISTHKNILTLFSEKLIKENTVTQEEFNEEITHYNDICNRAYTESHRDDRKLALSKQKLWLDSPWKGFFKKNVGPFKYPETGIDKETFDFIGEKFCNIPDNFNIHVGLKRILNKRSEMLKESLTDWSMGEAMGIGSLLLDKVHVRLSGQDVERGTFSHRHHVLHDQNIDLKVRVPLNEMKKKGYQGKYNVCNSSLSEYAVLGFELGYSLPNPMSLSIWEAQFGDFMNTAQCIIDQFISSGQAKWVRQSGLVMLLPHGYEGMGPEHSSAKMERFLQLCDDSENEVPVLNEFTKMDQLQRTNWQICNPTTPAQVFHLFRRQIKMPFRKPLVIFTPKSLLRAPEAVSPIEEYTTGTSFKWTITNKSKGECKRILFCTGKSYYELEKARKNKGREDSITIVRLEQVCPFPWSDVTKLLESNPNAEVYWVQEEHRNMGAYHYVKDRMNTALRNLNDLRVVNYAGRAPAAASATGNKSMHKIEERLYIKDAISESDKKF
ncbi:hypothetical protein SNEBB_006547 [Seison nebaliae]|nr:hypothetical protein SNEBB_006547 [Seison nebaliae]